MTKMLESLCKGINRLGIVKIIFAICCLLLLLVMMAVNLNSAIEDATIEKVKAAQKENIAGFKENKEQGLRIPIEQDEDVPGIVLINTGNKSPEDIESDDIKNIIVVIFEKGSRIGRINLIGMQKEASIDKTSKGDLVKLKDTFDSDNPQKMYDAIEKAIDYKVGSYIAYNNDTIKKIIDAFYIINVNVQFNEAYGINDVPVLNKKQKEFANKFGEETKDIINPGVQPLNSLQSVAYVNMYSDVWDCGWNDWRQLPMIMEIIRGMQNSNYSDLAILKKSIFSGDNDMEKDSLIKTVAALKSYKTWTMDRWPQWSKIIKYKNSQYVIPDNNRNCLKYLHKERHLERGYKPSEIAKQYCKDSDKYYNYVVAYNKEQAEKKRRAEAAKKREAEKEAAEKAKEDRNKTSSDTDTDKKDKTSDTGKSKSSSKKQSSSGSSGKKKTSSSGGNKKDSSGGSSSKPKPKPKPSSDSDDEQGEVVQPDNPEPTPDPQPEDSSHNSDSTDN